MENLRKNYPAFDNFIYLNSCSSGLFSNDLLAYRHKLDETFQQNGSNFRARVYDGIWEIKKNVASIFGGQAERMALISSCSLGLNMVLEALAGGQTVLHLQHEYPSTIWPFESRNFKSVIVENEGYSEEELIKHINTHQADILSVSMVQYSNGEIIAPPNFQAIKEAFPNLLTIVDATQFLGVAPFDFQNSGIDLFVASAFKWLCAGYGNGLMFFSEQLEQVLNSKIRGYNTYKNPRKEGDPTLGEFFEPGHQDLVVFKSLEFQAGYFKKIGYDKIQEQIKNVKTYAREKIASETPFDVITSLNPHMESGILSVDAPRSLVKFLNQNQVVCSYNRGLRLGIHFYNNLEDIDRLVEQMKRFEEIKSYT